MKNVTQKYNKLKLCLSVGFYYGILFGILISIITLNLNRHFSLGQFYLANFILVLIYTVGWVLGSFLLGIFFILILKFFKIDLTRKKVIAWFFGLLVTIGLFLNTSHYLKWMPYPLISLERFFITIIMLVGFGLVLILSKFLFELILEKKFVFVFKKFKILILVSLLLVIPLVMFFQPNFSKIKYEQFEVPKDTDLKVMIIGMDGGTFDIIMPLIEQGKLPNFKKLVDGGSYGEINTLSPPLSPILWTSVVTGKLPKKHGIKDFVVRRFKLIDLPFKAVPQHTGLKKLFNIGDRVGFADEIPMTSNMRISKAIWNIFSENGKKVGVVNVFGSWPAEKINGFFISDYFAYYQNFYQSFALENVTYPDELAIETKNLIRTKNDIKDEELYRFIEKTDEKDLSNKYDLLRESYSYDESSLAMSKYLLHKENYDFFITYFEGLDSTEHRFWYYMQPEYFLNVNKEDITLLKDVIPNYYVYYDKVLGELLNYVDDNTVLIVMSENGLKKGNHVYKPAGMLFVYGKNIKKNYEIKSAHILDIVPTVLYLNRQPIAKDMDGNVLKEVIEPEFLENNKIGYVNTYEKEAKKETFNESGVSEEVKKRLRELGYII